MNKKIQKKICCLVIFFFLDGYNFFFTVAPLLLKLSKTRRIKNIIYSVKYNYFNRS